MTKNVLNACVVDVEPSKVKELISDYKGIEDDDVYYVRLCDDIKKFKLDDNVSFLEFMNKWNEMKKPVSDDELLKIGRDAITKKRAKDDTEVLMLENKRLRKKLDEALEQIRQLNEAIRELMSIELGTEQKRLSKERRQQIHKAVEDSHNDVLKNIEKEVTLRHEYKMTLDENNEEDKQKFKYKNYVQWRKAQEDESNEATNIALERWTEFMNEPYKNILDFSGLNHKGKEALFPKLKQFLLSFMMKTDVIDKYKICFRVNGKWNSKKLDHETIVKLYEQFTERSFIYEIPDFQTMEYVSDAAFDELPDWSMFDAITIKKFTPSENGYKTVDGGFFPYKNTSHIDLKRYQIIEKQMFEEDKNKALEWMQECCFIYALKQTGKFSDEELNTMKLRITNRHLSRSAISRLCEEFHINLILHDIDDSRNEKNRLVRNSKGMHDYKCIKGEWKAIKNKAGGKVLGDTASTRYVEMNSYNHHYFIEERTDISSWYVDHIDEATDKQMHGWDKGNCFFTPKIYDRDKYKSKFLTSCHLVRKLMDKGKFEPLKNSDLVNVESLVLRNAMINLYGKDVFETEQKDLGVASMKIKGCKHPFFINKTGIDLTRYGIPDYIMKDGKINPLVEKDSFVHGLEMSNKFTDDELMTIKRRLIEHKHSDAEKLRICDEYGIKVRRINLPKD